MNSLQQNSIYFHPPFRESRRRKAKRASPGTERDGIRTTKWIQKTTIHPEKKDESSHSISQ
jgi:hypothetical protein